MSTELRDRLREVLDILDGIDVDPVRVNTLYLSTTGRHEVDLDVRTCGDFTTLCRALKVKNGDSPENRWSARATMRTYDAMAGDVVVRHFCFPHSPCWAEAAA